MVVVVVVVAGLGGVVSSSTMGLAMVAPSSRTGGHSITTWTSRGGRGSVESPRLVT